MTKQNNNRGASEMQRGDSQEVMLGEVSETRANAEPSLVTGLELRRAMAPVSTNSSVVRREVPAEFAMLVGRKEVGVINRTLPGDRVVQFSPAPTAVSGVYLLRARIVPRFINWAMFASLLCFFVSLLCFRGEDLFSYILTVLSSSLILREAVRLWRAPTFTVKVHGVNILPMAESMMSSLRDTSISIGSNDFAKDSRGYHLALENIQRDASRNLDGEFMLVQDRHSRRMMRMRFEDERGEAAVMPSVPGHQGVLSASEKSALAQSGNATAAAPEPSVLGKVSLPRAGGSVVVASKAIYSSLDQDQRRRLQGVKRSNAPAKAKALAGELLLLHSIQGELSSSQAVRLGELSGEFLEIMDAREALNRGPYAASVEERAALDECLDLLGVPLERLRGSYLKDRQSLLESKKHYLSGKYPSAGELNL